MTIKENAKLKPCPFCGGHAVNVEYYAGYYIKCASCRAKTAVFSKEKEAAAAWETRAKSQE